MPAGTPPRGSGGGPPADAAAAPAVPEPPAAEPSPQAPADLAAELGAALARAREEAGRSIQDVAEATRIRGGLIQAMEAGNFAPCGGDVYARGHLRSIAALLGRPAGEFLDRYDAMSGSHPALPLAVPEPGQREPFGPRELSGRRRPAWLLTAVAAAAAVAVLAGLSLVWPQPGGHGRLDAGRPVSSAAPAAPPAAPAASSPAAPPTAGQTLAFAGVNVVVRVHDQPSWVHVVDESGKVVFQGLLQPGDSNPFHAAQRLSFVFGYGPAIDLTVNGRDVGTPPFDGSQVSHVSFDASGTGQPG